MPRWSTAARRFRPTATGLKVTAASTAAKCWPTCAVAAAPAILMVLPGQLPARRREAGKAQVETQASSGAAGAGAVVFEEMILPEAGDVDITQQDVLVAVGRGIQQKDNLELAEELAQALGGAVAASRPIVDQGWLPATRQVGKSGMTVKPKCFIALGISGAPEHVEGMKDSDLIIAVNTDPNAPIFDVAHYGVVADLLDVVPALTEAIKARIGARMCRTGHADAKLNDFLACTGPCGWRSSWWRRLGRLRAAHVPLAADPGPGPQGEPPGSPRPAAWRRSCKEVMLPVADVDRRVDHQLGPPADLLGLLLLRARLGADVHRRDRRRPGWHIPQAEEIPAAGHHRRPVRRAGAGRPGGLVDPPLHSHAARTAADLGRHDRRVADRRADGHVTCWPRRAAMRKQRWRQPSRASRGKAGGRPGCPPAAPWRKVLLAARRAGANGRAASALGCWWIHVFILLFFLVYLPYSKHMHLIWAPFAVFFAELPRQGDAARPAARRSRARSRRRRLATVHLAAVAECLYLCRVRALRAGRARPRPAGPSSRPRQIVHDLKEFVLGEGIAAVRAAGRPATAGKEFIGGMVEPEALWACTTCYACVDKCPVRNEHVPLIVEMRRKLVEQGKLDATLQETLMSLQRYGNSQAQVASQAVRLGQGPARAASRTPRRSRSRRSGSWATTPRSTPRRCGSRAWWPWSSRRRDWISASSATASSRPATTSAGWAKKGCSRCWPRRT